MENIKRITHKKEVYYTSNLMKRLSVCLFTRINRPVATNKLKIDTNRTTSSKLKDFAKK